MFPLGLLVTSVLFDIAGALTKNKELFNVSYWMIIAGVVFGIVAAVPGLIDWNAIPAKTRAKSIGLRHAVGNVILLALFGVSWWLRRDALPADPGAAPIVLSFLGLGLGGVTGWLGGELVARLGVGVDTGAHVNAPSSFSDRPASDSVAAAPGAGTTAG